MAGYPADFAREHSAALTEKKRRSLRMGGVWDAHEISRFRRRFSGAGDEIRTHDPNLGKVVLYP